MANNPELTDITNFLRHAACFTGVTEAVIAHAAGKIAISYHRKNSRLPADDFQQHLWIVRSGAVATFTDNDILLSHVGEGDFFGPRQWLNHQHGCDRATMLEDSLLYRLPLTDYLRLCEQSPPFRHLCQEDFAQTMGRHLAERDDSLALTHRIRDLLRDQLVSCDRTTAIADAAALMSQHKISSLPIVADGELVGIVTDRDMRSRVVAKRRNLDDPVADIMSANPTTVDIDSYVFEAMMLMGRANVHHLPVLERGRLVGMITVTDLIRQQRSQPVYLIGEIWKARSADELAAICAKLPELFVRLVAADARASEISRLLTTVADATAQRLLALYQRNAGPPPVPFAWLAFGSQGREDLAISSDQDNALLLADDYDEALHGDYFARLATFVCDGLAACGYRYCPGDIMATSAQWRLPLRGWRQQFQRWIHQPEEKAVMFSSIFFDLRAIADDRGLFPQLQDDILDQAAQNRLFLAYMTRNALSHRPPLGLFRGLVLESGGEHKDELDIKHKGSIPITDIARQHALAHRIAAVNTLERLHALADSGAVNRQDMASLVDAHEFLAGLRFHFQAREIREGRQADNFISPSELSPLQRHHLKSAFKVVKGNQEAMASEYLGGIGR